MNTPLNGMRIIENLLAMTVTPVRRHKKRSHQTASYHARIQKKWCKRYGTRQTPGSYIIDLSAIGGRGRALVCHPDIARKIRELQP